MSTMKSSEARSRSKHIVLLPFMAQGHLKPFLQLAHLIRRRSKGLTITILTTPLNVQVLQRMSSTTGDSIETESVLRLVSIPFQCSEYGLPEEAENTNMKSLAVTLKVLNASAALEAPVRRFLEEEIVAKEGCPPLCIIADMFLGWAVELAYSLASLPLTFSTAGAYGTSVYLSIWGGLPNECIPDPDEQGIPFPETRRYLMSLGKVAVYHESWAKFIAPQLSKCLKTAGWLFNTVEELEPLGLSILRTYTKSPVWAVASTLPVGANEMGEAQSGKNNEIMEWLDLQPQASVLYISIGSQAMLTLSQMMEMAAGLEESGKRFLWVIRPPLGFDPNDDFKPEWLPNGFRERVVDTEKRGMLVHIWAPQRDILSHESIGAFLSHCGWNSVLESLSNGIAMIGLTFRTEQVCNVKMLEEMGVAVELPRGPEGCVAKEDVKSAVETVLDAEGKGGEMKRKAVEVGRSVVLVAAKEEEGHTGSSIKAIDDLLLTVANHSN